MQNVGQELTASPLFPSPFDDDSLFTIESVQESIKKLPPKKAPGILLFLFRLCWKWSYIPASWGIAQVIPIYKKGIPMILVIVGQLVSLLYCASCWERCLLQYLIGNSPPLDLAQGGFRHARGLLDQALCLMEICNVLRRYHQITPVLAFLDIKSAYDTVNRRYTLFPESKFACDRK